MLRTLVSKLGMKCVVEVGLGDTERVLTVLAATSPSMILPVSGVHADGTGAVDSAIGHDGLAVDARQRGRGLGCEDDFLGGHDVEFVRIG